MQGATHKHEHTRATAVLLMGGPTSSTLNTLFSWLYDIINNAFGMPVNAHSAPVPLEFTLKYLLEVVPPVPVIVGNEREKNG